MSSPTHRPSTKDYRAAWTRPWPRQRGQLAELAELADTLARDRTRRNRAGVEKQIAAIVNDTWAKRILTWTLTGDTPPRTA